MPRVLLTDAAQADLAETLIWYKTHAPEVLPQFRAALRPVLRRIAENPRQFPRSPRQTRRALLRRFPYLVIFREVDEAAYVVAVFHTSRNPTSWQQRRS